MLFQNKTKFLKKGLSQMFDTKVDKLIIAHCSDKGNLSNMDEYNLLK